MSDEFVKLWHEVLPRRFRAIERFNHGVPVRHPPAGFTTTLEIGAGVGEHIRHEPLTARQARAYHALELRESMAAELRESVPWVKAIVGDCQARLTFDPGFFDRVIAVHVLEHLPNLPACVQEVHRVLAKESGRFLVVIPTEGSPAYAVARKLSAERVYRQRVGGDYSWFHQREHINVPREILAELGRLFTVQTRRYFPLAFLPVTWGNLCIGLSLTPRQSGVADRSRATNARRRVSERGS